MPKNNPLQSAKPSKNRAGLGRFKITLFIITSTLFILCVGFISGVNQWAVKYIECGEAPVVITGSFEGPGIRTYSGQQGYGPNSYSTYECMTAEEKAGYKYRVPNYPY